MGTEGRRRLAGVATPAGSAGRSGHGFSGAAGLCPVAERGATPTRILWRCGPWLFGGLSGGQSFYERDQRGAKSFRESGFLGANDLT